jgi:hypothetical protein
MSSVNLGARRNCKPTLTVGARARQERKVFFFEKKQQKPLVSFGFGLSGKG